MNAENTDADSVTDPLAGTILPGGFVSETPPDVDDFLSEAGLTDKQYVCTIKRAPVDGSGSKEFLPGSLKGTYMPIEDCGRRFGPGQYFYCFAWSATDPETHKSKKMFKEYKIYLGTEWDDIHDDYMAERWAKKEKEIIKTAQQKRVRDAAKGIIRDDSTSEPPDQFAAFETMTNRFKAMGVPMFNAPAVGEDKGNDNNMMMFMMKMQSEAQDRSDKMTMFMMKMLIDKNGGNDTNQVFDKVFDLFKGVVNVKELLNPEKQSVVDKVFNLAESVLPAIMEIAKKPAAQRASDPLVKVVKDSADFNQMKSDPGMLNEAIRKWDEAHGVDKTNIILETVGLKRPGNTGKETKPEPAPVEEVESEFEDVTNEPEENVEPEIPGSEKVLITDPPDRNPMG